MLKPESYDLLCRLLELHWQGLAQLIITSSDPEAETIVRSGARLLLSLGRTFDVAVSGFDSRLEVLYMPDIEPAELKFALRLALNQQSATGLREFVPIDYVSLLASLDHLARDVEIQKKLREANPGTDFVFDTAECASLVADTLGSNMEQIEHFFKQAAKYKGKLTLEQTKSTRVCALCLR